MHRTWYVGRFPEKIRIVSAFGGSIPEGAEKLSPELASFYAPGWFPDDSGGRHLLLEILAEIAGPSLAGPRTRSDFARERVRDALRSGELRAYRERETFSGGVVGKEPEPVEKKAEVEKAFVEFIFEYPDGSPVKGEEYKFLYPDGRKEEGKLGDDGIITKEDVLPGTYRVVMKEVEHVGFSVTRARCDDEVKVRARVSGFAPGAAAKVKVYREHREEPGDEVASLDASVIDDAVEAAFKYDYKKDDARKREEGVARFVAEVALDGGKRWAKSARALELELKSISSARWSTDYAEDGDTVALRVDVLGFADGTEAKVDVFRFHEAGDDDEKVASLDTKVAGGRVEAACTYATAGGDGDGDGGKKGDVSREGEYLFEVVIEDGVQRKARSGLLWCTDVV
jgi:hypothetical protein